MEAHNMESQKNGYKWATWILVIVVIILAVMLTKSNSETITSTLDDATTDVQECRANIAAWQVAHPKGTVVSADAQAELEGILESCVGVVEDAQDEI
jgi:hypothetical protein